MHLDEHGIPPIGELESVAAMVSNYVYYIQQKLKRVRPAGRWSATALPENVPAEKILPNAEAPPVRKVKSKHKITKDSNIPPTIRKLYRDLRDSDVHTAERPLFAPTADYRVGIAGDAWRRLIEQVTLSTAAGDKQSDAKIPLSIPPSYVEHEIEQLKIGRVSKATGKRLCVCSYGDKCVAKELTDNNQPLHPYLTPSQQLDWTATGTE